MTALGDAQSELFDDLFDEAGYQLSVTRGNQAAVQVNAIAGRHLSERFGDLVEPGYGSSLAYDWVVRTTDYITLVGGEPDEFDRLEWTDDAGSAKRAMVGVDGTERHWDPVGQFGVLMRIHCTEVPT